VEPRGPAVHEFFANMGGRGEMIKAPIDLQDLRGRIYAKAKAEPSWCFVRRGFGWKRWSSRWLYDGLGLFSEYKVRWRPAMKASPA
jgi:hypothetical protein